jgi:cell division transport system permease protein
MQLVGATKGFVRGPFLKRGLLNGLYGGIIACILLSGIMYLIQREFPGLVQLQDLKTTFLLFGIILILGLLLSGISTFFAVRKYLRLKSDELYF